MPAPFGLGPSKPSLSFGVGKKESPSTGSGRTERARTLTLSDCPFRMMELTTLSNGLRVASRPMQSVETVAVGLYAETGSRHEPARLNGLAHLFEHMVFKGAGGRSAREISEAVEDVGGDLNASTDRELTAFYASLLAGDLPLGVSLIADLVRRPHFEPKHLELEKKVVL